MFCDHFNHDPHGVLNSDRHLEPPEPKNPRIGLAFARYEEIMEERAALDEERLSIRARFRFGFCGQMLLI